MNVLTNLSAYKRAWTSVIFSSAEQRVSFRTFMSPSSQPICSTRYTFFQMIRVWKLNQGIEWDIRAWAGISFT